MFTQLKADNDNEVTEIESLCMNCHENGITRLFLTSIPYFKEVVVMAFSCEHCNFSNNEIQTASEIQKEGVEMILKVNGKEDLGRQVVKAASASLYIKEIDLEVPPSQNQLNAVLTTVEGLVDRIIEDLEQQQEQRKEENHHLFIQIENLILTLKSYIEKNVPFTFSIRDISGNSFIENPFAPNADPKLQCSNFKRNAEDTEFLGLAANADVDITDQLKDEVHEFPNLCSSCKCSCPTRMKLINIPHFKEVVIMSTVCDSCGYKSNEVKSAGAISEKGRKIVLKVVDMDDLSRDILKSETSSISIPDIDLELGSGTLGGKFTTIEGLLDEIKTELSGKTPFTQGDGALNDRKVLFGKFLQKLDDLIAMKQSWTLELDDPMGNSYIQNLYAPDPDPNLEIIEYERTQEQNDFFGISDMVV
eukprot:NODE_74_length_24438_cov_0.900283.p4 type:complete len:419 gc:universal NODE_74_length_24438_cov_0.900283:18479-17223(-)